MPGAMEGPVAVRKEDGCEYLGNWAALGRGSSICLFKKSDQTCHEYGFRYFIGILRKTLQVSISSSTFVLSP